MEDRTKVCWYCHKATMKPAPEFGSRWYQCLKCGTTYNIPPVLTSFGSETETYPTQVDSGPARLSGRKPSGRAVQAAAKARKSKVVTQQMVYNREDTTTGSGIDKPLGTVYSVQWLQPSEDTPATQPGREDSKLQAQCSGDSYAPKYVKTPPFVFPPGE